MKGVSSQQNNFFLSSEKEKGTNTIFIFYFFIHFRVDFETNNKKKIVFFISFPGLALWIQKKKNLYVVLAQDKQRGDFVSAWTMINKHRVNLFTFLLFAFCLSLVHKFFFRLSLLGSASSIIILITTFIFFLFGSSWWWSDLSLNYFAC